jgi:hypothetical protein
MAPQRSGRRRDAHLRWTPGLIHGLDGSVFLWQRAAFDGADPPRDDMTAAYAAARRLPLDEAFRSAIKASELRLLFVARPHFLPTASRTVKNA